LNDLAFLAIGFGGTMGIAAKTATGGLIGLLALALSACGNSYPEIKTSVKKPRSKEYFAEAEYGVKASPRMVNSDYDTTTKAVALVPIPKPIGSNVAGQSYALSAPAKSLRRGGGRLSIGKPYMIRGKWYKPADQPGYSREGKASWYGDAFHGRLTANGEIYDMNNLTAAHPTLPLPSYARVTNLANGTSVIVRINDRGPYAEGRVIDLSKRVAQVLDTKHAGVGRVRVDYVGVAPVDGRDDSFLLASFRQNETGNLQEDLQMYAAFTGNAVPDQPVMVAQIEPVPVAQAFTPEVPLPVALEELPAPISRPLQDVALRYQPDADIKADRFGAILKPSTVTSGQLNLWKMKQAKIANGAAPVEILVGVLPLKSDLKAYMAGFAPLGDVSFTKEKAGIRVVLSLPATKADTALKRLWAAGYKDAFALR
jgi:rare lipoprotein A